MNNIQFTPHFELKEFTESATARRHGIANEPPFEAVENLKALCVFTLEPLREELGSPLIITSGYRSKAVNDLITHHSSTSQHMKGQAADFYVAQGPVSGSRFQGSGGKPRVSGSRFQVSGVKSQVSGSKHLNLETGASPMKLETGASPMKLETGASPMKLETGASPMKLETSSRRVLLIRAFRLIITSEIIDYDQLILYPTFIHVSYVSRAKNRHKLTKANGHGTYCALTREAALSLT